MTIDAEKGIANVCGEVDPNRLLLALLKSGQHAELINVKLKHPSIINNTPRNQHGHYNYGHVGHGYNNNYNSLHGPYGYNHALDEPTLTRGGAMFDQPYYGSTYHNSSPYVGYESNRYLTMDHVIKEEPMNWCSIM